MKKSFVILITTSLLFWSCASQQQKADPCLERQAVVEYGTSRVKFLVADKNICKKEDLKILNKTEWELETSYQLIRQKDGLVSFHPTVKERLQRASQDIKLIAKNLKVQKSYGLATGVYRTLSEREKVFDELGAIIGGNISLLSPEEEAKMGLLSIVYAEKPAGNFIVWDFGGNSMQFAISDQGAITYVTGFPGSNVLRNEVMSRLKKKSSPNPIGERNLGMIQAHLRSKFFRGLSKLQPFKNFEVYGIGGVHSKSAGEAISSNLNDPYAKKVYSIEQVEKLLKAFSQSSDIQISGQFPKDQATNLAAVSLVMKQMGWQKIKVSEQTLALGFMLTQTKTNK